jgi:protein arginine N-methyltransferase 1
MYGIDFTEFGKILCQKASLRLDRYSPLLHQTMGEPQCVKSLNLMTMPDSVFQETVNLPISHSGQVTGFGAYFKAFLDEETSLTNSPWAPQTHWLHLLYTLPMPRPVQQGDMLPLQVTYDGALRFWMP